MRIDRHRHFPPGAASVRAARTMVAEALHDGSFTGDVDIVLLLVSELATNAVRHAGTSFDLTVTVEAGGVVVAVVDHDGSRLPRMGDPAPEATSGRGLRLVDQLSSSWGTEPVPGDGKRVWFRC